ncbi:hypothetical protein EXN66_Car010720 [Channa argus]|uniref:Uncharacterized protein n=1 Tax=Channa argus TaxID=215402 RepID=A0A6G1PY35_CHAAH|nr:hypothetical protein EXN66_Car010720 [Channa argus]
MDKSQTEARRTLAEWQQEAPSSKLLGPVEAVMEVVPKFLQGTGFPPRNTSFNFPSKQVSKMAVGATKAVQDWVTAALSTMLLQVPFSQPIRDEVVLSIHENVGQDYALDVFVKRFDCFAADKHHQ